MKKILSIIGICAAMVLFAPTADAQRYKTAIGLGLDVGNGPTLGGPQIKHFFDPANAGNAQVLFGDDVTVLGVDYSYNQPIRGARGLSWYVGVGPQLTFVNDDDYFWFDGRRGRGSRTFIAIRPALGMEFKIPSAPIAFHFDWKPWWNLTNNTNFEPGRFSIGFKFALK